MEAHVNTALKSKAGFIRVLRSNESCITFESGTPVLEAIYVRPQIRYWLVPTCRRASYGGARGRIVPFECGEVYKKALSASDLVVIDSCGHSPQIERPVEFVKSALEFLG